MKKIICKILWHNLSGSWNSITRLNPNTLKPSYVEYYVFCKRCGEKEILKRA